jgi:lysophospholipase L1-like esterase
VKRNRLVVLVFCVLLVGLVASISLNWVLFRQGRGYYLELNRIRLDPLGSQFYVDEAVARSGPNPERIRVLFLGDSRAYDWPPPTGLTEFEFINLGIGAQTSAQVLGRFGEDVAAWAPAVIIIQVGVNDLKAIPLFPENRAAIVSECQRNIDTLVAASRDLGIQVILTTIFPLGQVPLQRRLFWSADVARAIVEVNDHIRSLQSEEVIVLDAAAVLEDERGHVRKEHSRDLLHLAPHGYEVLNENLGPVLVGLE